MLSRVGDVGAWVQLWRPNWLGGHLESCGELLNILPPSELEPRTIQIVAICPFFDAYGCFPCFYDTRQQLAL